MTKSKTNFFTLFFICLISVFLLRNFSPVEYEQLRKLTFEAKEKACAGLNIEFTREKVVKTDEAKNVDKLIKASSTNKVEQYLNDKNATKLIQSYIPYVAPIIIMFILSIFGFVCYCFCCSDCCPPKKCRRDLHKKPFSKHEYRYPAGLTMMFTVAIIVSAAIGISFNNKFEQGYKELKCSLIAVPANFLDGMTLGQNSKWIGITGVGNVIAKIINDLNSNVNTLQNTFANTSWIQTGKNNISSEIDNIYNNYNNVSISCPTPNSKCDSSNIIPFIIKNLGPRTDSQKDTGIMNDELNYKVGIVADITYQLKLVTESVAGNMSTIQSSLNQGKTTLESFTKDFQNMDSDIMNFSNNSDKYSDTIFKIVLAYFILFIFSASLAILGVIIAFIMGHAKLRVFLHISWVIACILMLIGWIVALVTIPSSMAVLDMCRILDKYFEDPSYYNSTKLLSNEIKQKLFVCIYSDGDLNKVFNIKSELDMLAEINTKLINLKANLSLLPASSELYGTKYYLPKINSILANSSEAVLFGPPFYNWADPSNPEYVIWRFNSLSGKTNMNETSDLQAQFCEGNFVTDASFIFKDGSCRDGYSRKYSFNPDFQNVNLSSCFKIGNDSVSNYNNEIDSKLNFSKCGTNDTDSFTGLSDIKTILKAYYNSLFAYNKDVEEKFGNLSADVKKYNSYNQDFVNKLSGLTNTAVTSFNASIFGILDAVTNPTTGLIAGLNCRFLKYSVNSLRQSLCVSFIPVLFWLGFMILLSSGFAFVGSCCTFLTAGRVYKTVQFKNELNEEPEQAIEITKT